METMEQVQNTWVQSKLLIHDNGLMESQGNPETVPRGNIVDIQTYQWKFSAKDFLKFAKLWVPGPLPKPCTLICIYVSVHIDDILPKGCFKPQKTKVLLLATTTSFIYKIYKYLWNSSPLQWKDRVSTTGLPGKSIHLTGCGTLGK